MSEAVDSSLGEKKIPNSGNGSKTDIYQWTQTLSEIEVDIFIPEGTPKSALGVDIQINKLKIVVNGHVLINDQFNHPIKQKESIWTIDRKSISLTIIKKNQMEWWSKLLSSEPEIDTQKIVPENSKIGDLDDESQAMVRKIREEQRRKMAGLPSIENEEKNTVLKKFMNSHPEMDFSNAKIA